MSYSKRYKFIAITTENGELLASFEQYQNPKFLFPKQNLNFDETELWSLDREYFSHVTKRQGEGMLTISPESISLLKTHDELHKGFLEIRRLKSSQGIPTDVDVKFA